MCRWSEKDPGPSATQRCLNPGFSERIRNSRRTGAKRPLSTRLFGDRCGGPRSDAMTGRLSGRAWAALYVAGGQTRRASAGPAGRASEGAEARGTEGVPARPWPDGDGGAAYGAPSVSLRTGNRPARPDARRHATLPQSWIQRENWEFETHSWFRTGDVAAVDADDDTFIVGRKKDMIIAGGYNIYPDEIDAVLVAHPTVLEAATVGIPDPKRGETVKSFVVLRHGQRATANELTEYCRRELAAYKVPRSFAFLDELPKSSALKILRRELQNHG